MTSCTLRPARRIPRLLILTASCLLAWAQPSAAAASTHPGDLLDDVRVLRSDEQGLELLLTPAWRIAPSVPGQAALVRAAHCTDPDRPRRRLQLALPPGSAPVVTLLESRTRSCAGPLAEAGFTGANPEPELSWSRLPWGDLEVLALSVDLLRRNGPVLALTEELRLRIDYGPSRAPGFASRLGSLELSGLLNPVQAGHWARAPLAGRDGAPVWDGTDWLRLPIAEEGLYTITPALLEQAGLQPAQLDPRAFKLYGYGGRMIDENPAAARNNEFVPREIPVIRETDGDGAFEAGERLVFYGRGTSALVPGATGAIGVQDHFYSDVNVYWLLVGGALPGREMAAIQDDSGDAPFLLPSVRWRGLLNEHKAYGETSARACMGDVFRAGTQATYSFSAPLAGGATTLRLEYDFYPDLVMNQDALQFEANGQVLTAEARPHNLQVEGTLPLSGDELRIGVERLTDSGNAILLNWLCPSFEAPARFVDGRLAFELPAAPGSYQVQLEDAPASFYLVDVTDFDSLRVTHGTLVVDRVKSLAADSTLGRARRYFGMAESRLRTPTSATPAQMPDLKAQAGTTEMIVIAPAVFAEAAAELVAAKNQAGRTSARLVLLEEVYDEFNGGVPDPGALRNFLRHEWLNATQPAGYVLLVGNGHYDYRGLVAGGAPLRMPVWYLYSTSTTDADAMIDDWFVQLESASHLDMALGRLPANSADDVQAYTDKLLSYETAEVPGLWRNHLLFVADDEHGESGEVTSFEFTHSQDSEELIQYRVPGEFDTERLYLFDYPSVYNPSVRVLEKPLAEARLLAALNEGTALVNFLGHGNNTTWTHEYVFNAPRHFPLVQANGKPAVFLAATCSWAEIDLPIGEAFPQQLINMAGGGAIGVMAATRKTGGFSNVNFVDDIFTVFFSHDTLGLRPAMSESMRLAKNVAYDQNRRKYIWLGDPSLRPGFPEGGGSVLGMTSGGAPSDTLYSHSLAGVEAVTLSEDDANPALTGEAIIRARQAPVARRHNYDPYTAGGAYHNEYLDYESPGALLFAGSAELALGRATPRFMVPADVTAGDRPAQLRIYYQGLTATGVEKDGLVYFQPPLALNPLPGMDGAAPALTLFLNGPQWRPDDWVAPNSQVVLAVSDSSGVNLTGEIGHRLEVEIDGGTPQDLTNSFEYQRDSWTAGEARLDLPQLEPGLHHLRARAFDNFNNPGYAEAEFHLLDTGTPTLAEAACFPNPVGDQTQFTFQLLGARLDTPLDCTLQVYTVKGRRVARETLSVTGASGFLWTEPWWPRNDQGDALARGIYLARLSLRLPGLTYSMLDENGQYVVNRQQAATIEATAKMIVR